MPENKLPTVVIVTFPATTDLDDRALRQLLESAGADYVNVPGLRRKYFLSGDGLGGGVYEWDCRASAEAFYDNAWHAMILERSGAVPDIRFFDSPAIADGVAHRLDVFLPEDRETKCV